MTKRTRQEIEEEALQVAQAALRKAMADREAALDAVYATHAATCEAINAVLAHAMGWLELTDE